jgi:hypothetical protein
MRCLHGIRDATYAWQHGTVLVYCLTAPLWSGDFWLLRNLTIFNKFENHIYVFQKNMKKTDVDNELSNKRAKYQF